MASPRKFGARDEELEWLIIPKARKYARHPALREWTVEDLEQQMRLIWLLLGGKLDSTRGDIIAFADVIFNNHLANLITAQEAEMRDYRRCTRSLDDPVHDREDTGMTRHEVYSPDSYFNATGGRHPGKGQEADMRVDVSRALMTLPAKKRELAIRLTTQTMMEAAKAMGISRQTASVWRGEIRDVFRNASLLDYLPGASERHAKKPRRAT